MPATRVHEAGAYRFIPGVFQYSAGVAAQPGFRIERVRLRQPVPLAEGFRLIERHLGTAGRPLAAFCACELRSPGQFDEAGFEAFNRVYVATLERWGLYGGQTNPVARSNVCPQWNAPPEPSLYAFCYTVADPSAAPSFVIAGSGEAPEGRGNYHEHIVSRGDVSAPGLRRKAAWVLDEMERRMSALGFGWQDISAAQVYTVHDIHVLLEQEFVRRGALREGLTWQVCRPPVAELEFEMDCRLVQVERMLATAP